MLPMATFHTKFLSKRSKVKFTWHIGFRPLPNTTHTTLTVGACFETVIDRWMLLAWCQNASTVRNLELFAITFPFASLSPTTQTHWFW